MNTIFTNAQRARVLTEALPYIKQYNGKIVVIKYGGNAMINEELKQQVMEDICLLWLIGVKVVLVHGGGKHITALLDKLNVPTRFENGYRVTDEAALDCAEMALSAQANKAIVTDPARLEVKGVGISGKDGAIAASALPTV